MVTPIAFQKMYFFANFLNFVPFVAVFYDLKFWKMNFDIGSTGASCDIFCVKIFVFFALNIYEGCNMPF